MLASTATSPQSHARDTTSPSTETGPPHLEQVNIDHVSEAESAEIANCGWIKFDTVSGAVSDPE